MLMHKITIMMHARPIRPHKITILVRAIMFYFGGITRTLSIYIASRQLHSIYTFMVSVPTEEFISAQPKHTSPLDIEVAPMRLTLHTWLARIHFLYLCFTGHARVNTPRLCDHDHYCMVDAYNLYVAIQNVLK
jgi:hypothetical protein